MMTKLRHSNNNAVQIRPMFIAIVNELDQHPLYYGPFYEEEEAKMFAVRELQKENVIFAGCENLKLPVVRE